MRKDSADIRKKQSLLVKCILAAMLFCVHISFFACKQETYDSGDGQYSYMRADFVEIHTNSEGKLFSVMTDDGDSLLLTVPAERKWASTADSTYRSLLYYNKVENKAELISISNIPTPLVRDTSELEEGMKTDPVKFISSWKSTNKRYLNLELSLMTGNADGDTQMQKIGCICDSVTTIDGGASHVWLSLYHDQGGVPEYYSAKVYMSIKTSRLPVAMKTGDQVSIRIPTYSGFIIRTFEY